MNKLNQRSLLDSIFSGVILIGLFSLSILMMVALFSYSADDGGWAKTEQPIGHFHNLLGQYGAYYSDLLLSFLGFVAYFLPFILVVLAIRGVIGLLKCRTASKNYFLPSFLLIGLLGFLIFCSGLFGLSFPDNTQYDPGGILGNIILYAILPSFGYYLSAIFLLVSSLICLTLLLNFSWSKLFEIVGSGFFKLVIFVLTLIAPKWVKKWEKQKNILDFIQAKQEQIESQTEQNQSEAASVIIVEETAIDALNLDEKLDDEDQNKIELNAIDNEIEFDFNFNPSDLEDIIIAEKNEQNISESIVVSEIKDDNFEHEKDQEQTIDENNDEMQSAQTSSHRDHRTYLMETKDDSIIHPFLRRNILPIEKPTTDLPALTTLNVPPVKQVLIDRKLLETQSVLLEKCLSDFRIKCRVIGYEVGPVITRFELELAAGVKASRISSLDKDIARSLSLQSVRVVEVIPGKPYVGIELPNPKRQTVYFKDILESSAFQNSESKLTIALGQDISGKVIVADLAKMPHLLVAGTTGSGKSVGVNAMILSILFKAKPDEVRFIMIDPKMLELSIYRGIPHLLTDVITDMKDVTNALNWCVQEMENRYRLMSALSVRNISSFNERVALANEMGQPIPDPNWSPTSDMAQTIPNLEKLPYIVVVIDEFADLIMTVGKAAEELIARLAQKARAAGIHIILATQRPSVDVITGLIKANIPTRIGFTVSSKIDSRTILDQMGAETLLGMGDMLYLAPNSPIPIRVHGAFIDDDEVNRVVQDWKARNIATHYIDKITQSDNSKESTLNNDLDPLYDQVYEKIVKTQKISSSLVQRFFNVGFNRAARIVDQLEANGVVSEPSRNGTRKVLIPASEIKDDFE